MGGSRALPHRAIRALVASAWLRRVVVTIGSPRADMRNATRARRDPGMGGTRVEQVAAGWTNFCVGNSTSRPLRGHFEACNYIDAVSHILGTSLRFSFRLQTSIPLP